MTDFNKPDATGRSSGKLTGRVAQNAPPALFRQYADRAANNGFSVIPIKPGDKKPALPYGWSKYCTKPATESQLKNWHLKYAQCGVGIAGGNVVGVDIDSLGNTIAIRLENAALGILGETPLIRVGQAPKRLLVYRADGVIPSRSTGEIDIIGVGRQFVAMGIHPATKRFYEWIGYGSPFDTCIDDLPTISTDEIEIYLQAAASILGVKHTSKPSSFAKRDYKPDHHSGLILDGREAFLRDIVMAAFANGISDRDELANIAWERFQLETDLSRPKGSGKGNWTYDDAYLKAGYILRRRPTINAARRKSLKGGFWSKRHKNIAIAIAEADRSLTASAIEIHKALLSDMNRDGSDLCAPSVVRLMEVTGLSRPTVMDARNRLRRAGIWDWKTLKFGRYPSAHYTPKIPFKKKVSQLVEGIDETPSIVKLNNTQYLYHSLEGTSGPGDTSSNIVPFPPVHQPRFRGDE